MTEKRNYCAFGVDGVYRCGVARRWTDCLYYYGAEEGLNPTCIFCRKADFAFDFVCVNGGARSNARERGEM